MPAPADSPSIPTDFLSTGRIIRADQRAVVLNPHATTYEIQLATAAPYSGPLDQRISGLIRASARKLYTTSGGGAFITPIAGPPRIVQGQIRWLDEKTIVVCAAALFVIDLPAADDAYDLAHGPLVVGQMVNAVLHPGSTFEPAAMRV